MDGNARWIAAAFVMGLCVSYAVWSPRVENPESERAAPPEPIAIPVVQSGHESTQPQAQPEPPPIKAPVKSALRLDPLVVDFGELKFNSSRSIKVNVANSGKQLVKVTDVHASCGCVKADMPMKQVAPGKSELLKVTFAGTSTSPREKFSVTLSTDEAGSPALEIPVKAKVRNEFILSPQTINFDHIAKNSVKTFQATINQIESKPFKIKNIISTYNEFSFKWEAINERNPWSYKILVTAKGIHPGPIVEAAAIATDDPDAPIVPLYLNVEVDSELRFFPAVASATLGAGHKARPFEFEIEREAGGDLTVQKIEDGSGMKVSFTATSLNPRRCKIVASIDTEFTKQPMFGEFLVSTNADEQAVRLPYRLLREVPKTRSAP